jgi:MinD superfamily P-loop ATPase
MKELVIVSGKGGTGKTTFAAALATLASASDASAFADCDVDAADLHLIFSPDIRKRTPFLSGREAIIDQAACVSCGQCARLCRFDAVGRLNDGSYRISGCEGCGVCVRFCPAGAIAFPERRCGEWYLSDTRFGPLAHARLDAEAENSGKLVSLVRKEARALAEESGAEWLIVDGSPGIGCPVIASVTGADAVLAVVEPSLSGKHDLERVVALAKHFKVRLMVAVNKADINPALTAAIADFCAAEGLPLVGTVPYDTGATAAQVAGKSVIEYDEGSAVSEGLRSIWKNITEELWKR